MDQCIHHPARTAGVSIFGNVYCSECLDGIAKARQRVDKHVAPRDCFILYEGNGVWQPVEGTGCAHWVAHQLNIHGGEPNEQCLAGYSCRVNTILIDRQRVMDIALVQVNDIYVTPNMEHVGLVCRVTSTLQTGSALSIIIRHATNIQGSITENEFATHFDSCGYFYR
jgi:hypothetical protein